MKKARLKFKKFKKYPKKRICDNAYSIDCSKKIMYVSLWRHTCDSY